MACSWSTLLKVSKALGFSRCRITHYIADNSGSTHDCMPALLSRFTNFFNENPHIEWESIPRSLRDAPFEPTPFEYEKMLPLGLRKIIGSFLDTLCTGDRKFYDPFFPKTDSALASQESTMELMTNIPCLLSGNVSSSSL